MEGIKWYRIKKGFLAFEGGRTREWHLARGGGTGQGKDSGGYLHIKEVDAGW